MWAGAGGIALRDLIVGAAAPFLTPQVLQLNEVHGNVNRSSSTCLLYSNWKWEQHVVLIVEIVDGYRSRTSKGNISPLYSQYFRMPRRDVAAARELPANSSWTAYPTAPLVALLASDRRQESERHLAL